MASNYSSSFGTIRPGTDDFARALYESKYPPGSFRPHTDDFALARSAYIQSEGRLVGESGSSLTDDDSEAQKVLFGRNYAHFEVFIHRRLATSTKVNREQVIESMKRNPRLLGQLRDEGIKLEELGRIAGDVFAKAEEEVAENLNLPVAK